MLTCKSDGQIINLTGTFYDNHKTNRVLVGY